MLRQQQEEEKIEALASLQASTTWTEYANRKEKMLQLRKQKEEEAKRLAEMQNTEEARVEGEVKKKEARDMPCQGGWLWPQMLQLQGSAATAISAAALGCWILSRDIENDEKKRLDKLEMMRRQPGWEDDIQKSRQAQIQRKQNARAKEKAEDAETAKFLAEWCKVLDKQAGNGTWHGRISQEQEENRLKDEAAKKLAEDRNPELPGQHPQLEISFATGNWLWQRLVRHVDLVQKNWIANLLPLADQEHKKQVALSQQRVVLTAEFETGLQLASSFCCPAPPARQ
eukprot:Skav228130  [mRNA]  locus=scaffold1220:348083:353490:+ [translate_table: standard]